MSPRARYRAAPPVAAAEPPKRRRWLRRLVWVGLLAGYGAAMWYLVFPWVDRTFVNRPAL